MMIPEWVLIALIGGFGWLISWGVMELVRGYRKTNTTLESILARLVSVDGRLIATETWKTFHDRDDAEKFGANEAEHKELWRAVTRREHS